MSGIHVHVKNLTDAELYNELIKQGFPAGPVVASTRKLYQSKLSQILEGTNGHGIEQELLPQADEIEEQLTQPVRRSGMYEMEERLSQPVRSGTFPFPTYYTSSREQENDDMRTQSSVSSSYLDAVRGVRNYEGSSKAIPSWLSSSTQPCTSSSSSRTFGTSGNESFRNSQYPAFSQLTEESPGIFPRHRTTLSDMSPAAWQEMGSRYRVTGHSDAKAAMFNRQRKKSVSFKVQLVVFVILALLATAFSYMVYEAWHQNDPYQQIEQDVVKIIEERNLMDKQQ